MNPNSHSSYYWHVQQMLRNERGEETRRIDMGLMSWREVCEHRFEGYELFTRRGPLCADHDRKTAEAAAEAVSRCCR